MKTFSEKSKKILCKHKDKFLYDNYIYAAPVIFPKVNFDEEEINNKPVCVGSESVYKCEKCGRLKIVYYRKFKED